MTFCKDLIALAYSKVAILGWGKEGPQDCGRGGALKIRKSEDLGRGLYQAQLPPLTPGTGAQGLPPQGPTLFLTGTSPPGG